MTVDVLAVGAHPDDVEIGVGGIVRKLTDRGKTVGILDLTRGEMGSRGSAEERHVEAARAAEILGVTVRRNAGLPDGAVANTPEQQRAVIGALRELRPRILLALMANDRHPDHHAAHGLLRAANYFAGLTRIETAHPPHRAERVYFYRAYGEPTLPDMVVDVSAQFDTKLEALRAYASQFHNPDYDGPETFVASESFWESIRVTAAYWGHRIGAAYGEALHVDGPLGVDLPPGLEDAL